MTKMVMTIYYVNSALLIELLHIFYEKYYVMGGSLSFDYACTTHVNVVLSSNFQLACSVNYYNKCKLFCYNLTRHTKTHYQMCRVMYKKQASTHNRQNCLVQLQYWSARI